MSANPRSAVLGKYLFQATGTYIVAQSPAGHTVIVKQVLVWIQAVTAAQVIVYVVAAAGGGISPILGQGDSDNTKSLELTTWTVLAPGDAIYVQVGAIPAHVWVSGTVLTGTAADYVQPTVPSVLPAPGLP